jgi:hypothetical protein
LCNRGDPWALRGRVRMLVQGDDNLMRHAASLMPDWRVLGNLGFKCENIYRRGPRDAEFCSSRLYPVRGGYCFGPKLGRLINKFLAFNNPPLGVSPYSVAKGVALGLVVVATYVPLLSELITRVLALTAAHQAYFLSVQEPWRMTYRAQHKTVETQEFVDEQYGLTGSAMRFAVEHIQNLSFHDHIDSPTMQMLFDRDTAAPQVIWCH